MLRVAFINPSGAIGGAERSLLLLLEQIDRRRIAPVVYCGFAGPLVDECAAIDVPARVAPLGSAERLSRFGGDRMGGMRRVRCQVNGAYAMAFATAALARVLRADRPHLIHTNGIKAHLIGGACGRLLRCPVIWHMRDLVEEGALKAAFLAAADCLPRRIIAISRPVAEQFCGRRADRVTRTIHNAVDPERFRPHRSARAVRAELGITADTTLLAMVAHFTPWKGHALFLDVLARLVKDGLPVAGLIVGASIYRGEGGRSAASGESCEREIRARVGTLDLDAHVRFTGYQSQVADYLAAADILVHPPVRPEPFGRVLIEAMALAKPVVAAAAGGIPEIVVDGETGYLVPPGDVDAFVRALRPLLSDPGRRAELGRAGRERVTRSFHPASHARAVEAVYEEAHENHSRLS